MRPPIFRHPLIAISLMGITLGLGLRWSHQASTQVDNTDAVRSTSNTDAPSLTAPTQGEILVLAGGGAPHYNEIALEKNVHYFQRTLDALGINVSHVQQYFANGNNGEATVRYLNPMGQEQFKPPSIENLNGAATMANAQQWFEALAQKSPPCPGFFYFTGHGAYNHQNIDDNALILWDETLVSVQQLAGWLDQLPTHQPFVTMMAQCYAGSFANLIYEQGHPANPIALQPRCGFFATVATRPSVGCTPAVNEADYRDYSSSFFAGLSGIDRTGQAVESADYDGNGTVSYAEAHAFAKVDEATTDWPVSTVEVWLQKQASDEDMATIFAQPMDTWMEQAPAQRQYVIQALSEKLDLELTQTYAAQMPPIDFESVRGAYWVRLGMELANVAMAQRIQQTGTVDNKATLNKLTQCEGGNLTGAAITASTDY